MLPALSDKRKKKKTLEEYSHKVFFVIQFNISTRRILKYIVHRYFELVARKIPTRQKKWLIII
jgi:hypothetical protein